MIFSQFGVYNNRLELKALQKFGQNYNFEYIPVLDDGLSVEFEAKVKIQSENIGCKRLLDEYEKLEMEGGFQFLNSEKGIRLQEEMREYENQIIDNETILEKAQASIDGYENAMI